MRSKRGAALPTAVALCTILLIVSLAVTTVIMSIVANNKVTDTHLNDELYYLDSYNSFIKNPSINLEELENNKTKWELYEDGNIKALVAKSKTSDNLVFYSVYDFSEKRLLAYQTDSFYHPLKEDGYYYYAGIVKGEAE